MRIGITGGTGFIGQYFIRKYSGEHQLVAVTSRADAENLYKNDNVSYVKTDYTLEGFKSAFDGCNAVVHLGAGRPQKNSELSLANYIENMMSSENVFNACYELGITNIVNISSISVYDNSNQAPFEESCLPHPMNNYGISKLTVEGVAHLFNVKKAMKIKSLRLASVIGYGERDGYMLTIFLNKCLNNEKLSVYGTGSASREYIYVKDVVAGIMCALQNPEKTGVYNMGMGHLTSNLELAQTYCRIFDNKSGYEILYDKAEVIENRFMNVSLLKNDLGFQCEFSLIDAVTDIKKIIQEGNIWV